MIEIEISEPVFQFLGGIFHQDIEAQSQHWTNT